LEETAVRLVLSMSHVNTDLTCMDLRTSYRSIALSLYDEKERKSQKHLETALVD